jgi:hypothetical protein
MRNSKGIPKDTVHHGILFSERFCAAAGVLKPCSDNAAETFAAWSFFSYDDGKMKTAGEFIFTGGSHAQPKLCYQFFST